MKLSFFKLRPSLSALSWFWIEFFFLITVFFLPFSKSAAEIGISTSLILWILRKFPWDERFPYQAVLTLPYALFLFFTFVSLIHVPPAGLPIALRGAFKWVKYLGIFFMGFELFQDARRQKRFIFIFILSMTLASLNGLYQASAGQDLVKHYSITAPDRYLRIKSSFSSPNDFAAFLVLAVPVSFFLWVKEKKWSVKSLCLALVFILFGVLLILTLSRAAFFGLFISIILCLILHKKIAAAIIALGIPLIFNLSFVLRENFLRSFNLRDITIIERLRFWKTTLRMIREHPFLGNGVNMFLQKFPEFASSSEKVFGYAHNCLLQMWAEIGLFGVLAFFTPLLFVLAKEAAQKWASKETFTQRDAWLVGIAAFLIQSFFDTNFYALQASMIFWIGWSFVTASAANVPTSAPPRTSDGKCAPT